MKRSSATHPGVGGAVALSAALLFAFEILLQVRSHVRTGQSVFAAVLDGPSYVYDEAVGARLLRPNATIAGAQMSIRSNRYGLRGADFPAERSPGEIRIALLGASTVMGTYARTGETSSEQLEHLLVNRFPGVRVINAGIAGLTLEAQAALLEQRVRLLRPDVIFWYPGTNDISCDAPGSVASTSRPPFRLPRPEMPSWVLSSELLVKNTRWVRERPESDRGDLKQRFDIASMRATVERVSKIAREAEAELLLVTAANSYRAAMNDEDLALRASSAVFFRPCYSPRELADAVDAFNEMLRTEAARLGLGLVDAATAIPPEPTLFGDASHFSPKGERRFAELLASELVRREL